MVKLTDAVIARFEHSGERFEMLVDPYLAMDLKHGKEVNFDDLLAADTVFKDANKGDAKSEDSIKKVFHTTDIKEVARKIIIDGDVQLTTQQKREMIERKRTEIITFISRNALNPQTNSPHPPQRIENAMTEAKIQVDIGKSVKEQIPKIVSQIKKFIPISMEKIKIAVKIPATYAGKANVVLHKYGIQKEEWQRDGSLIAVLELPAGIKQELFSELNSITHGDFESKIVEEKH